MKNNGGVVLWETYLKLRKRWIIRLVVINLFYLAVIGGAGYMIFEEQKQAVVVVNQNLKLNEFLLKREIYDILRLKGVSLSQGLDIADIVFKQCKELGLPPRLVLAVMSKESNFSIVAISSQKAMGIMQIHPVTWKDYVSKLNLDVSLHAAFDPILNIKVATIILKDLYEHYKTKVKSEPEIWKYTLSAYYAGKASLSETGMQPHHINYVQGVKSLSKKYETKNN